MADFSRVTLIGNLAADPQQRATKAGKTVCSFPIAVNRTVKLTDGSRGETADFHRITAWSKLGETVAKYLKKGRRVMLEGRLKNSSYNDKEGKKRYSTEVVMDNFFFMDSALKGKESGAAAEKVAA